MSLEILIHYKLVINSVKEGSNKIFKMKCENVYCFGYSGSTFYGKLELKK